jgi:hypothetical protein
MDEFAAWPLLSYLYLSIGLQLSNSDAFGSAKDLPHFFLTV